DGLGDHAFAVTGLVVTVGALLAARLGRRGEHRGQLADARFGLRTRTGRGGHLSVSAGGQQQRTGREGGYDGHEATGRTEALRTLGHRYYSFEVWGKHIGPAADVGHRSAVLGAVRIAGEDDDQPGRGVGDPVEARLGPHAEAVGELFGRGLLPVDLGVVDG